MQDQVVNWLETGVGVGAFVTLVWLIRHVTSTTIPSLIENFKTESQSARLDFKETMKQQVETFERVNKEQRVEFREVLERDRAMHHTREESLRAEFRELVKSQRE